MRSVRRKLGSEGFSAFDPSLRAGNQLGAELELKRLGKNPHPVSHGHYSNTRAKIDAGTDGIQVWYWLIDYRNGNKRLLRRAFSRLEAWKRNETLRGSGRAWAMCND